MSVCAPWLRPYAQLDRTGWQCRIETDVTTRNKSYISQGDDQRSDRCGNLVGRGLFDDHFDTNRIHSIDRLGDPCTGTIVPFCGLKDRYEITGKLLSFGVSDDTNNLYLLARERGERSNKLILLLGGQSTGRLLPSRFLKLSPKFGRFGVVALLSLFLFLVSPVVCFALGDSGQGILSIAVDEDEYLGDGTKRQEYENSDTKPMGDLRGKVYRIPAGENHHMDLLIAWVCQYSLRSILLDGLFVVIEH